MTADTPLQQRQCLCCNGVSAVVCHCYHWVSAVISLCLCCHGVSAIHPVTIVSQKVTGISQGTATTHSRCGGIFTTCSELYKVLFLALWLVCLCMKYLGNCWTDLCQIHREDVFGPSLGRVWMSRSEVKVTSDKKWHFWALSAACMWFVFGKTFSSSYWWFCYK